MPMRPLTLADMHRGEVLFTVEMPYAEFVENFGPRHSEQPPHWDAPGPVELWFFELPWGHKITLEYHLTIAQFNVYLEVLEVEAVIDFLGVRSLQPWIYTERIQLLQARFPVYSEGIRPARLCRLDDNGNTVLMQIFESPRVAEYHRDVFERRGHKQMYWVET